MKKVISSHPSSLSKKNCEVKNDGVKNEIKMWLAFSRM